MKIIKLTLIMVLAGLGRGFSADAPVTAPAPDPLSEALPILQKSYVDFGSLGYKPGDHLSDLIFRSGGRIDLVPPQPGGAHPIVVDVLPDGSLYWRLGSFTLPAGKTWSDLTAQLQKVSVDSPGIVLDLRSNATPDDYRGAVQVLDCFGPAKGPAKFRAPMIVLTNGRTEGAAEALAGYFQADGALVVGRATAGHAIYFQESKLSSGEILRFAAPVSAASDPFAAFKYKAEVPEWAHPVVPDIALNVDEHSEKAALILIKDDHLADVIGESPARHRMSEAALIQGQDPEWDEYLASLKDKPVLLSLPVVHDAALITALDSLKAIRLSQLNSIRPPAPASGASLQ